MTERTANFQIYLPGLLRVLAESLYSDARVGVRELLQNAHDSCVRRMVEGGDPDYQPRVDVSVNRQTGVLTIEDNGSGLTAQEIEDYLSTIGRSYTRQLGESLQMSLSPDSDRLIGQFGMGFLSAFLIASDVTLTTRSFQPGAESLQWRSSGDIHYTVSPAPRRAVGTQIMLTLKDAAWNLTQPHHLEETIRRYADFLPVPIHVFEHRQPANAMQPPWEAPDPEAATEAYIARKYGVTDPMAIIPLHDHTLDLGHDTLLVPLRGFLFIPPGTVTSLLEYGDLNIYIRRMFITHEKSDLLPSWARFVRGDIESAMLQPTASREQIQRDQQFTWVQQAIREQLTAGLRAIARQTPVVWRMIVNAHREIIIGWAAKDMTFFHEVADLVPFRTTRGVQTLPEYLADTGNVLYYITRGAGTLQDRVLSESYGRPVIDASQFFETAFLQRYIETHRHIRPIPLDRASEHRFPPLKDPRFDALLAFCREHVFENTHVVSLDLPSLPAVILYPKDAELIQETRDILNVENFTEYFADIIDKFIEERIGSESLEGTFYLNANNATVEAMAAAPFDDRSAALLRVLFEMARLFNGRLLDAPRAKALFADSTEAMARLIKPQA